VSSFEKRRSAFVQNGKLHVNKRIAICLYAHWKVVCASSAEQGLFTPANGLARPVQTACFFALNFGPLLFTINLKCPYDISQSADEFWQGQS
jgi:hypothetical protein